MTGKSALIVLASSSQYRREQLKQLQLPFINASPQVDETPFPGEQAEALARRLSIAKARSVLNEYPEAIIVGSDQTAEVDGQVLGKPLTKAKAMGQLTACQGKHATFYSGLCVINGASKQESSDTIITRVTFRTLSSGQIRKYVEADQPLYCTGSFKCESLGIALFSAIESQDPTALVGLPLIRLNQMLCAYGVDPLAEDSEE